MKYREGYIAKDLYSTLQAYFKAGNSWWSALFKNNSTQSGSAVRLSIKGAGVHWNCTVASGGRTCTIACFNYQTVKRTGPEYYVIFDEDGQELANGRTSDKKEAIVAVSHWMDNKPLTELHKEFAFVDAFKRKLEAITEVIIRQIEVLSIENISISKDWSDSYNYHIKVGDKECHYFIDYYNNDPLDGYGFKFLWDGCAVFYGYRGEITELISVIRSWLIDQLSPSATENMFPWIMVYPVAVYYEQGEGITGEFMLSWDRLEDFYREANIPAQQKVIEFIKVLRSKGYDRTLRAGTSLYRTILSRSRRYGMRTDQHSVRFDFAEEGMRVSNGELDDDKSWVPIAYSEEIDTLLRTLEKSPIN